MPSSIIKESPVPAAKPAGGRSLWLWVAAGFLFLGLLWTAMFIAARGTHIDSVPITTQGGKS